MKQGGQGETVDMIPLNISVDRKVDHSKESIGVDVLFLTYFLYGLVAKSQAKTEAA